MAAQRACSSWVVVFRSLLALASAIWLQGLVTAAAQAPAGLTQSAEDWAWAQIKDGKVADFNQRCGPKAADAMPGAQAEEQDKCRLIRGGFLADVLTRAAHVEQITAFGVRLVGARVAGDLDLRSANLEHPLVLQQCLFDGSVNLDAAKAASLLEFSDARVGGRFTAEQLRSDLSAVFVRSIFLSEVSLADAKIDGYVNLAGAQLHSTLNASSLQVGTTLFMGSNGGTRASYWSIDLHGAKIGGQLSLEGATVAGNLIAVAIQVGDTLFLRSQSPQITASFQNIYLTKAKVGGNLDMSGATVAGALQADSIQVEGALLMFALQAGQQSVKSSFNSVNLNNAKIGGQVSMADAMVKGRISGDSLRATNVFLRAMIAADTIDLPFAQLSGNLDLRGARLAGLDLSGAVIGGDLRFGTWEPNQPTTWLTPDGKPGALTLHNARTVNLTDTRESWPGAGHLHLDGFAFAHLGGFEGDTGVEMRGRGMQWWDEWARRDPLYTPAPYEQLSAALIAAGDRASAEDIRYLGRVRQREAEKSWFRGVMSGIMQYVAGFGIGTYTFRVLYWVIGITFVGGVILCWDVPQAKAHGRMWCFGASFARLLPVIEINKEFTEFFHDPCRKRLTAFQNFIFSFISLVGWFLGAVLIAAWSGLLQDR